MEKLENRTYEKATYMYKQFGHMVECNDGKPVRVLSEYVEEQKNKRAQ